MKIWLTTDKVVFQINGKKIICKRNGVRTTGQLPERNDFKLLPYLLTPENFQFNKDLNINLFPKTVQEENLFNLICNLEVAIINKQIKISTQQNKTKTPL